ncbi:MAG: hypothetical protein ACE5IR_22890, partial [bacterium]
SSVENHVRTLSSALVALRGSGIKHVTIAKRKFEIVIDRKLEKLDFKPLLAKASRRAFSTLSLG